MFSSKNLLFTVTVSPARRRRMIPRASLVRAPRSANGTSRTLRALQPCSPPRPEFETAAGNDINHGDVLGQADWVVKRQQQHAECNANSFGADCDCAGHRERRTETSGAHSGQVRTRFGGGVIRSASLRSPVGRALVGYLVGIFETFLILEGTRYQRTILL